MKKFTKLSVLAATLFTLAFAPLAQASAAGYGQGQYNGGGYWGQNYEANEYQQVRHKRGYKHRRGYRDRGDRGYRQRERRMHHCESPRYRWSKECRRYHRGWRR